MFEEAEVFMKDGWPCFKCPHCLRVQDAGAVPKGSTFMWLVGCENCGETIELVERGY